MIATKANEASEPFFFLELSFTFRIVYHRILSFKASKVRDLSIYISDLNDSTGRTLKSVNLGDRGSQSKNKFLEIKRPKNNLMKWWELLKRTFVYALINQNCHQKPLLWFDNAFHDLPRYLRRRTVQ